ncbi:nicotinamide riboside transporter PnuC [Sphingobacterium daejeonense]|uniref:nicotinamide riboside transporter PnuC n=1 Tax=Sphingobacterium daejeonense TaxID=371142 RepID=UPI003D31BBD1
MLICPVEETGHIFRLRLYPIPVFRNEPDPGNAGVGIIRIPSLISISANPNAYILEEILQNIIQAFQATSWLERFSVLCGIVQVLLSKNNKVSNYFFGILGITTGMMVLFHAKLYAEIALQIYYLIMSIYGWWYWVSNKQAKEQPITKASKSEWMVVLGIVFIGFFIFYFLLKGITDSDVPIWDAWVTSTAWAGMWLLAKRKIENWILLNISNLFAIPLLIHKNLYLFAALTTFLFIVAIFGYLKWRKIMAQELIKSQNA